MAGDTVEVRITASSSEAVAALKGAASASRDAAESIRKDFAAVGHEASAAHGPIREFTHHLQVMRTEGRASSFMALQIAEMGLASKGAAREVTGLVSAFAFGGGLGVAIEGVKMLVKAVTELGAEEEKAQEEAKKRGAEMEKWADGFRSKVETMVMAIRGATAAETLFHADVGPLLEQEAKLKQDLITANVKLAELREQDKHNPYGEDTNKFIKAQKDAIVDLGRALKEVQEKKEATLGGVKTVDTETVKRDAQQAAEAAEQVEKQHALKMLQLDAEMLDGVAKLEGEYNAKVASIIAANGPHQAEDISAEKQLLERKIALYRAAALKKAEDEQAAEEQAREAELAAADRLHAQKLSGEQAYQVKLLDIQEEQAKSAFERRATTAAEEIAAFTRLEDEKLRIKMDSLQAQLALEHLTETEKQKLRNEEKIAVAEHEAKLSAIRDQAQNKSSKLYIAQLKEQMAAAKDVGSAIGDIFGQLATGAKTFADAMKDMAKAVVRSLIEMAIKSVEAAAIRAGGEAAAATAGIPGVGPILAIGAMAATEAAVLALLSGLPSAAGGWRVPTGINPVAQLHSGEHVIPAAIAQRYEEAADGMGGDGGLHLHFPNAVVVDGPSIRRFMERPEVAAAVRGLKRDGRWPG